MTPEEADAWSQALFGKLSKEATEPWPQAPAGFFIFESLRDLEFSKFLPTAADMKFDIAIEDLLKKRREESV